MSSPQVLPPLPNTRRIITTHNASRSATIAINEHKEPTALEDGTYLNPLWSSDELPATIDQDPTKIQPNPTAATTGGSVFSTYDLPPKYEGPMHRSITLDYITVTQGVVTLSTDDGSTVTLRAGDTVVQRGTMHKWGNPSDEWARLTSVMVQARPVVVDGKEMEAVWPF
ncbi:hypothetical protein CBS115989_7879 [Aspergillus niger]|uniref:Cupin type-2 domain-containing protein n=2 Tax=Aspergillus niger TaxID=5061 RepID=G3Y162_ASPNA|nr:hypothetical protein ASPNIDRAFT_36610 [Aspergillus niger ATCC 1015]KAI2815192.1 hypothetical protein CBS115989_7879 [Aspergillus niger]KAI2827335.1 hypothetical protein CBS133816_6607 [Aspergillus niger]KAI2845645.1 hypothetical protein CBS11350_4169 [Aspergillus niger]KAI2859450.1 hypothetical protein CBS11232_1911 [Aspergillus niger]